MSLATSERHKTLSYCVLMNTNYLQHIAISLAVSLYLAQKLFPQGMGMRSREWVQKNYVLDASLDLQNHQKKMFNGSAHQEMASRTLF